MCKYLCVNVCDPQDCMRSWISQEFFSVCNPQDSTKLEAPQEMSFGAMVNKPFSQDNCLAMDCGFNNEHNFPCEYYDQDIHCNSLLETNNLKEPVEHQTRDDSSCDIRWNNISFLSFYTCVHTRPACTDTAEHRANCAGLKMSDIKEDIDV